MHSWHRRVINGSKERNIHQPITQNRHVVSSISSIEQEDPVNGEGGGRVSIRNLFQQRKVTDLSFVRIKGTLDFIFTHTQLNAVQHLAEKVAVTDTEKVA